MRANWASLAEGASGQNAPAVGVVLQNLGGAYYRMGTFDLALQELQRAVAINERALSADHPLVVRQHGNVALLLEELGRYDEAAALNRRVVATLETQAGPDEPDLAAPLENLASALTMMGRAADALFDALAPPSDRLQADDRTGRKTG